MTFVLIFQKGKEKKRDHFLFLLKKGITNKASKIVNIVIDEVEIVVDVEGKELTVLEEVAVVIVDVAVVVEGVVSSIAA